MLRVKSLTQISVIVLSLLGLVATVGTPVARAAVDKVICVPWQGDINKYHTTWSGHSIQLKGLIRATTTDPVWYRWVYGDGSESTISSLGGKTVYNVETAYVYTGSVGTPFTARLVVADNDALAGAVSDPYLVKIEAENLDSRINVAIDNGLWYLFKSGSAGSSRYHTFDGSAIMVWSYSSYFSSPTASAIHAFQINGHKESGDPDEDPYVTAVEGGLNWLFNGYYLNTGYPMLRPYGIGTTPLGDDPDTTGNGIGIEARDYGYRPAYQGGMVVDAIIASGTPDADCGRDFDGDGANETYREVVQEMIDLYAWGQYDGFAGTRGGWRYSWNQGPDNSACQWAAIAMIPAQAALWNCTVPEWVKTYNDNWLHYSYAQPFGGHPEWGGFGYTGPGWGHARTPSGMVQLSFVGAATSDSRWTTSERWLADNWTTGYNWLGQNNVYAYYAFAKAMRLALPDPVVTFSAGGFDWYRGDGITMGLAEKVAGRLVTSGYWDYYGRNLGTAWSVIILKPVLFAEAPVACFDADPNPSYADSPVNFDPGCSTHSEPGKGIANLTLFEWDWDSDGSYDTATATPDTVSHAFACASIPCVYPVTLRVSDDSDPVRTATYVMNIRITNPPHPPVADSDGFYMVSLCPDDTLVLDGSGSYDPDEEDAEDGCGGCPGDTLTAWEWDLFGAPWDFTDESGPVIDFGSDFARYFSAPGNYDIGLRVTDNSALSYPGSGAGDLSDEDFTRVEVYEGCICEVTVEPGCQRITLSWEDIGADIYLIYRSVEGLNAGYEDIGRTTSNVKTMGSYVMGSTTYYRIMAVTGNTRCLSRPVTVYADPSLCNPVADPNGPYTGCVDTPLTLDGSGSTALAGTIVTWEWDLDNDGAYDDAFGETVPVTFGSEGTRTIGLQVTSSDSLVLKDEAHTTVQIESCGDICGDLDNDGDVDGDDRNILRGALRTCSGDPGYMAEADLDGNGCVNYTDYQLWYRCYKAFNAP